MTKTERLLKRIKLDGWANALSGLGSKKDKTKHMKFSGFEYLSPSMLSDLWAGDGLAKKIVSAPSDDATKNWLDVVGDDGERMQRELDRLKAPQVFNTALKWARLFGGSVIVVGADDGRLLSDELGTNVRNIDWLKVYPSSKTDVFSSEIIVDPKNKYFDDVERLRVYSMTGQALTVHRSRCLLIKGDPVPQDTYYDFEYRYWGMSALQPLWEKLANFGGVEKSVANVIMELIIGKYKMANLAEMLADDIGRKQLYARMEIIDASKSIINGVLLGDDEEYSRDTASLGGVAEVMDRFMMSLSGAAEIPVSRLFGRSAAGMNATGEGDRKDYYDKVVAIQENQLSDPVQRLIDIANFYVKVPGAPTIEWRPVEIPSEMQMIDMRNKQANTDKLYLDGGVLSDEEIRQQRFMNGYSFDMSLPDEAPLSIEQPGDMIG